MESVDLGIACAPWQSEQWGASIPTILLYPTTCRLFAYTAATSEWHPEQSTALSRAVCGSSSTSSWQSVQERSACTEASYSAASKWRLIPGKGEAIRWGLSGPPGVTFDALSSADQERMSRSPWQSRHSEFSSAHGEEGVKARKTATTPVRPAKRVLPRRKGNMGDPFLFL